jgi:hypothetical protein
VCLELSSQEVVVRHCYLPSSPSVIAVTNRIEPV